MKESHKIHFEIPILLENPLDIFYLTRMSLSLGKLLFDQGKMTLYVDGRYLEMAKKTLKCSVLPIEELKNIQVKKMGLDSSFLSFAEFEKRKKDWKNIEIVPIENPLKLFRAIKDAEEIKALKRAARLSYDGFLHIQKYMKEGVSEKELSLEFEFFCKKHGASHLSFDPVIAFGKNSAYPHYRASKTKLKLGDVVLIDVGAVVEHYAGDMTRMIYFGPKDERIVKLETIVRKAQKKAIENVRPGVKMGELDQIVRDEFEKENVKQLYMHGLGHGVGLDVHEFPRLSASGVDRDVKARPGMVFTIEPGLYQEGVGGVRIEDVILVTQDGYEIITP